jgi:hypothetical protein
MTKEEINKYQNQKAYAEKKAIYGESDDKNDDSDDDDDTDDDKSIKKKKDNTSQRRAFDTYNL